MNSRKDSTMTLSSKIKYDKKEQRVQITLEKGMADLRVRLAKAEGRLAQHDNPHTPSSKKPIGQKNNGIVSNKPEGRPKKPGAQKGHQGVTSRPKPTTV